MSAEKDARPPAWQNAELGETAGKRCCKARSAINFWGRELQNALHCPLPLHRLHTRTVNLNQNEVWSLGTGDENRTARIRATVLPMSGWLTCSAPRENNRQQKIRVIAPATRWHCSSVFEIESVTVLRPSLDLRRNWRRLHANIARFDNWAPPMSNVVN